MNYDQKFQILKIQEERGYSDFDTNEKLTYNDMFKIEELEHALETCEERAAGHDSIMYGILNHLPPEGKENILKLYNKIWISNLYPRNYEKAIIVPIPKGSVTSYANGPSSRRSKNE
ncbi:hypothetical protein JTB14_006319 [Gonioctena quinquepunctata]|nr:hypothetical protein JTB14_006319 [Gonioctena quinquepunctata]